MISNNFDFSMKKPLKTIAWNCPIKSIPTTNESKYKKTFKAEYSSSRKTMLELQNFWHTESHSINC